MQEICRSQELSIRIPSPSGVKVVRAAVRRVFRRVFQVEAPLVWGVLVE